LKVKTLIVSRRSGLSAASANRVGRIVFGLKEISEVARGTVKWFNTMKGYGFVKPDDRKNNLFFHVRNFPSGKIPEPASA
jgi:hypothetical protein